MFYASEIHSLSDFQRHTREHMERLRTTGRPALLTVNGKAAVVVQDAEAYEKLLAEVESARIAEMIRQGLDAREVAAINEILLDIENGGDLGDPVEEVMDRIRRGARHRPAG